MKPKYDAKYLRESTPTEEEKAGINKKPIILLLDNVMDTYNIGSIFRLAEAVAAKEIILCGQTETPPSSRIHKAAVGTEEWVPWRYFRSASEAIYKLREEERGEIIGVEQSSRAENILNIKKENYRLPVVLVAGHETEGVSPEALNLCDRVWEIPMWGVNKSLNVVVSMGIAVYSLINSAKYLQ